MSDKTKHFHTVHLKFSESEIAEIDTWQEVNHIRTRSEAIRQMIRRVIVSQNAATGLSEKSPYAFKTPAATQAQAPAENAELKALIKAEVEKAVREVLGSGGESQ